MEIRFANGKKLRLVLGDITQIRVDAIVNAANSGLHGGGGVDGAIHRAGGSSIMRELNEIRPRIGSCPAGDAVVTGAGSLPAQYVFHAVGPIYHDGHHDEPAQLKSCYERCLELAEERDIRSISFPAISTGAYGYPPAEAANIALHTVADHLESTERGVREVLFVLFDQGSFDSHAAIAARDFRNSVQ
ncbi:MAG TPA: O-acetyl-ADP-ribose deacetylase [Bryobacteraceae bacterium]|nr:O-acetyl-ADP-ribose deacetylase [Bryobacteraceae bacterium]